MSRPSSAAPSFGRLLLAALRSVGIDYVTLDHLRKAKKNSVDEHEYIALWRLLHDLVLVVLLDFQVDSEALRRENTANPAQLAIWQELARFYLYEWGFVSRALYEDPTPSASVLLLAFAWLLARSQLVHRQSDAILRLYMGTDTNFRQPPYANDMALTPTTVKSIMTKVTEANRTLQDAVATELDADARLQQIQALAGRVHMHQRTLQASLRAYRRLLQRVEQRQRDAGADADDLLPAYAVQLLASGKPAIDLHVRAITARLAMAQDEKLFYKWVNGLLLLQNSPTEPLAPPPSVEPHALLASQYESLYREILATQQILQQTAPLFQQIARLYAEEKSKWTQRAKTRTQQAKMDEKMAKLSDDIASNELFDCRALLLERSDATNSPLVELGEDESDSVPLEAQVENLQRLQEQLQRVMREISTQYCHAELV